MLGLLLGLPAQCQMALEISQDVRLDKKFSHINKIVISGMGGSAVSGDILRSLLSGRIKIPILVNRDYTVPEFVDNGTLFFTNSYSGNTEETLSAFENARAKGASIIGITSGGKLGALCRRYNYPLYKLPGGQPPRTAIGYLFFPLLHALIRIGLVKNIGGEIEETISYLKKKVKEYGPSITQNNLAHTLTRKLFGFIPIIYGSGETTGVVAFRWKTQFNENSKILAFNQVFPELDHNEIMAWEGPQDITRNFVVLVLKDKDDSSRMKKRINITLDVMGKKPHAIYEVSSEGRSLLTRIFSLVLLGDFLSFYLAIARGVDPTLIKGISTLKERLAKS
jgi:glucose/mannose-6-phosphate isomerase